MTEYNWEKIKQLGNKKKYGSESKPEDLKLDDLNKNQIKRFMRGISDGPRGRMKSATFRLRKRSMIKEGGKV